MLLNGILINSEAWYNVTKGDIEDLEKVDREFLKGVMNAPKSTPTESLYLELGIIPIKYIIMARRLNFLQYITKKNKDSLIFKFFNLQWIKPETGDWTVNAKKDLEKIDLRLDLDEISEMSKKKFKTIVKKWRKDIVFKELILNKDKHRKMNNVQYRDINLQPY